MALRQIVKETDPQIRKKSREVTVFDEKLGVLLDDMHETMIKYNGCGLAGVQVGILRRVAVVDVAEENFYRELVNPVIVKEYGENEGVEGCLSVDNYYCYVVRPEKITVEYYDRYGKKHKEKIEGFPARACCHEIDHLDGILFKDKCSREIEKPS